MPTVQTQVRKKRTLHYIHERVVENLNPQSTEHFQQSFSFKIQTIDIESDDLFEEELLLVAFPISYLHHIPNILRQFDLQEDAYYFYHQCKELLAIPEKHTNDKGGGKLDFQSFFNDIPYSLCSINDTATVIIVLHPLNDVGKNKKARNYRLIGYIHAVELDFIPDKANGKSFSAYYFNMLRISNQVVNGKQIYRRKRIFSVFFNVFFKLSVQNGMHYSYASMGRENVAINTALARSAKENGAHHEFLPFKIYSKINWLYGSSSCARQLVDITNDPVQLDKMYELVKEKQGKQLFFHLYSKESFLELVKKVTAYSKNSRVYMVTDGNGQMKAATFAIHWGDYFSFKILNPKGILRLIAALKITEKILYPTLAVGEPKAFKTLLKGIAYHYHKNYGTHLTFMPTHPSDPLAKVKKSILSDEYNYFILTDQKEDLQRYKQLSADGKAGDGHLFVEQPLL